MVPTATAVAIIMISSADMDFFVPLGIGVRTGVPTTGAALSAANAVE